MFRVPISPRVLVVMISAVLLPAVAHGQTRSLTWSETTRVQIPGPLGALLGLGGATSPSQSTNAIHVKGLVLAQEGDGTAAVIDLDNRRFISVDHENRQYMTFTFEEMGNFTREMVSQAENSAQAASPDLVSAREELERELEATRTTLDFQVRNEARGEQRTFAGGVTARRHLIIGELKVTSFPEGTSQPEGGSFFFVTELWKSTDVPSEEAIFETWAQNAAADEGLRAMAAELAGPAESANSGLTQMLTSWDPQVAAAMLEMEEAAATVEGTTIMSVLNIATVPLGIDFDPDVLLAWEPESMGDRLRAETAGAAREAASNAIRGALGGLFGGGGRSEPVEPEPASSENEPQPLLRITTSRENLAYREHSDDPIAGLMDRISGYSSRTFAEMMQGVQ